jgi:hypothetical protein
LPPALRDVELVDPPAWLDEVLAEADADLAVESYMSFGSAEKFDAYARQVTADDGQVLHRMTWAVTRHIHPVRHAHVQHDRPLLAEYRRLRHAQPERSSEHATCWSKIYELTRRDPQRQ